MASALKRFKPLADRVLVQIFKPELKSAGGIYLPEATKQSINQAKVVAVGAGRLNKEGATLPINVRYGGMNIKFDEEEYKIFRDEDIVGVMGK